MSFFYITIQLPLPSVYGVLDYQIRGTRTQDYRYTGCDLRTTRISSSFRLRALENSSFIQRIR